MSMKHSTYKARQKEIRIWFRCLEHKFPGDQNAQRTYAAAECDVSDWSMRQYRKQATDSTRRRNGGIPSGDRHEFIAISTRNIIKEFDLTPTGRMSSSKGPEEQLRFTTPAPAKRTPFQAAAKRVDAPFSNLEIVRGLTATMTADELKVVFDHTFALLKK